MSTNKTQNYQLHSWVPQDDFHVSEINENFAALDAALKGEAVSREEAVSALSAEAVRILCGQYKGNDGASMTFELGVTPKAVLVCMSSGAIATNSDAYTAIGAPGLPGPITCTSSGFQVAKGSYSRLTYPFTFLYFVFY